MDPARLTRLPALQAICPAMPAIIYISASDVIVLIR